MVNKKTELEMIDNCTKMIQAVTCGQLNNWYQSLPDKISQESMLRTLVTNFRDIEKSFHMITSELVKEPENELDVVA